MRTCNLRCPQAFPVEGSPYPLFRVGCSCGTVCLGKSEDAARTCWLHHVQRMSEEGREE